MEQALKVDTIQSASRITLPVYNLGCGGGGSLQLERTLAKVPGVSHVVVNPATEMAYLAYDPQRCSPGILRAVIEQEGFGPPRVASEPPLYTPRAALSRLYPRRLAFAAALLLSSVFLICIAIDWLLPARLQMHQIWEQLFLGYRWEEAWTIPLGLLQAMLYGALTGFGFGAFYNFFPKRLMR